MKIHFTRGILACFLLLFFALFGLAQAKLVAPKNSVLQPMPVNVIPDVSHNINSTSQDNESFQTQTDQPEQSNVYADILSHLEIPQYTGETNYYLLAGKIFIVIFLASALVWVLRRKEK